MKKILKNFRNCSLGTLILCFCSLGVVAGNSHKTSELISLKALKSSLVDVIQAIEASTDYSFVYSENKIPLNSQVEVKTTSETLTQILSQILPPLGIAYQIREKSIILIPSDLSEQLLKLKGSITGTIRDTKGNPMEFATVVVDELNQGTVADHNGIFRLTGIPEGNYQLQISFLGYKKAQKAVVVRGKQITTVNVTLTESQSTLDEAVVYGNMSRGQASALNQQKNSKNIKNVVSSEQFSRFPDRNAAEVVARIPAVSVDYDQGEGQNVQIRGLSPDYNSLTLDGERIPAPDPDDGSRGVGLDLLNQNLIQSIEVVKAITPDMDGDAIGGSVNFKLKKAPDVPYLQFGMGGGYNLQHSEFRKYGKDIQSYTLFGGKRFFNKKLGVLFGGSYYKTNKGSMMAEYDFNEDDYVDTIYAQHTNDYDVKRQRFGFVMNADYQFNPYNQLYFNLNMNVYWDDEIRRQAKYSIDDAEETRETRNRREDQRLNDFTFGGKHKIGTVALDYKAAYIRAEEKMPDRTYWRYARDVDFSEYTNDQVKAFSANTVLPSDNVLELNRLRCDDNKKTDRDISASLNLIVPFKFRNVTSSFKIGGKYLDKHVYYWPERTDYKKFSSPLTIAAGTFGQEDVRYTDYDIDALGASSIAEVESSMESRYKGNEAVAAEYGMVTLNFNKQWTALGGVRLEHTHNKYQSLYDSDDNLNQELESSDYTTVLPSLHVTYKPTDKINLRMAYSTGLSRPNYTDLVPVEIEDDESDTQVTITEGNPDLKPTTSNNLDLMFERYTNYLGFFSAGVFYKTLANVISSYTYQQTVDGVIQEITQPQNRDDATVWGMEFAVNQRLHFINSTFLKDMTIYANYTYTHSKYEVDGREIPLGESPRNVFNLALMYDNAKTGWSFVISNVYRSPILESEGDSKYLDTYYDREYHLDLSIGKRIYKKLNLLFQINNISDQQEKEILGDPSKSYARLEQWEKYNSSGMFTLQYNF